MKFTRGKKQKRGVRGDNVRQSSLISVEVRCADAGVKVGRFSRAKCALRL